MSGSTGPQYELTQIKRHRGGETEGRQRGSLTHGKKTPEIGVNEHEPGTEKPMVAQSPSTLWASESGRQEPDARRVVRGLPLRAKVCDQTAERDFSSAQRASPSRTGATL